MDAAEAEGSTPATTKGETGATGDTTSTTSTTKATTPAASTEEDDLVVVKVEAAEKDAVSDRRARLRTRKTERLKIPPKIIRKSKDKKGTAASGPQINH